MGVTSCSAQNLVISLYDYAGISARDAARLTSVTNWALAHTGIHIAWRYCRGALAETSGSTCEGAMHANNITIRLQPKLGVFNGDRELHMGTAFVEAEGGSYATVFVPAVRTQAAEFGLAFDVLMGYAVAHEVGHCLLGPSHSSAGLMRGAWNRKDAVEISRFSLHLTKQESRKAMARVLMAEAGR